MYVCMRVSIFCVINTLGAVEQERSRRETRGVAECFFDYSSALQLPECLYHSILGFLTTDAPSVLLEKGQFEKVNVMAGVTDDEGSVTTNAEPGIVQL